MTNSTKDMDEYDLTSHENHEILADTGVRGDIQSEMLVEKEVGLPLSAAAH